MIDVQPPQPATRRTRVVAASVGGGFVAALAVLGVWALGSGLDLAGYGTQAQDDVAAAQAALEAGDSSAAVAAVDTAEESVAGAVAASRSLPLALAAVATGPDGFGADVPRVADAADDLVTAAAGLALTYQQAAGNSPDAPPIFSDGVVDLARLEQFGATVTAAGDLTDRAVADVQRLGTWLPGVGPVDDAKAEVVDKVEPLQQALDDAGPVLARLPDALGADGQKRYLVALLNPAELRATGGAPLTVAVVAAEDGRVSIPLSGTFSDIKPEDEVHTWDRVAGQPFARLPDRPDKFANSNNHPDFTVSAQDMERSWDAYGLPPVDGVIALDMTAVEAMLRATGPVDSPFGQITADNVVQTLLVDAYADYGNEGRELRRQLNQQLMDTVIGKLTSGSDLVPVAREVLATADGRHVQAYVDDSELQAAIATAGLDGALTPEPGKDRIAAYTTNTSGSKLDVFQARTVDQVVTLREDGGADVVRRVVVVNEAPAFDPTQVVVPTDPTDAGAGLFYEQRDARNQFFVYVPDGAEVTGTGGTWSVNPRIWDDGVGGRLIRTAGTVPQGTKATVRVAYSLPAGTFTDGDAITYRAVVEPQAVWRTPTLRLTVIAPGGWAMTTDGSVPDGWAIDPNGNALLERPLDSRFEVSVSALR